MRILFAGDEQHYSEFAMKEVVRLAMNTWADVTFVGVIPGDLGANVGSVSTEALSRRPLSQALSNYRETFLSEWGNEGSPYSLKKPQYEWVSFKSGQWEQLRICRGVKKDLKVRLRTGDTANEILTEARNEAVDLIGSFGISGLSSGSSSPIAVRNAIRAL